MKNKKNFSADWALVLALVLSILVILRSETDSDLMRTFFRQFLILVPGVLGEMIFLIAGRVDLSVGGTIILLKQILSYLIMFRNFPVFLSAVLLSGIALAIGFAKAACTCTIRSPFEVITYGIGYLFTSLASGMNLWILQNSAGTSNTSVNSMTVYVFTLLAVICICWLLEKTAIGRSIRIFGSDPVLSAAMHMPIRKILITASLLSSLLLMDHMLCQVSRTGLLTQLDSANLTYNILAGGMIGTHVFRKYKNVLFGSLVGTLEIVLFNAATQFYGLPAMLIWTCYGGIILISVFTTPVLNESIRSRIER